MFEVRFELRSGRKVQCWSIRTNILDDAEGYDAFKGADRVKIEIRLKGRIIDVYVR